MCTGQVPFKGSGTRSVLERVCEATPSSILELNPDVPGWMIEIIDRLHAKEPAQRFQSASELAELLRRQLARLE
jgi:serine/threonine protein kinase